VWGTGKGGSEGPVRLNQTALTLAQIAAARGTGLQPGHRRLLHKLLKRVPWREDAGPKWAACAHRRPVERRRPYGAGWPYGAPRHLGLNIRLIHDGSSGNALGLLGGLGLTGLIATKMANVTFDAP
jgi:hypothetical protein